MAIKEFYKNWRNPKERFIAFFDIMGFKDYILRNKHEIVGNRMNYLAGALTGFELIGLSPNSKSDNSETQYESLVLPIFISDSIILISKDGKKESASQMLTVSASLLITCMQKSIPIKGAISYGLLTANVNGSIYFGQPLIDAVILQEELQLYGAVLDNNAENILLNKKIISKKTSNLFLVKYRTPLKGCKVNHYNLNWLALPSINNEKSMNEIKNKLYNSVSGKPRVYVDNTMNFVEYVKTNILNEKGMPKQSL